MSVRRGSYMLASGWVAVNMEIDSFMWDMGVASLRIDICVWNT